MEKIDPELLRRLDALAAKLGTTAEHVWQVLLRQARVEIVTDIILFVLAITFCVIYLTWLRSAWHRSRGDLFDLNSPAEFLGLIFGAFGGGVLLVLATIGLIDIPTLIFNPEFWALKQIMGAL